MSCPEGLIAFFVAALIALPASAQAPAPASNTELQKEQAQFARDRKALEDARKSGDPEKIKAAENRTRAGHTEARKSEAQLRREREQARQLRAKTAAQNRAGQRGKGPGNR